ncbi:MAG: DUF4340 domain-containing protein [Verrucomicrobia bacterium]|nr:DUF4340 domain-containing protein [Verrucomicrobiota bacterium]
MKKILLLLIVLGGVIGTALYYQEQQNANLNTASNRGAKIRERLLPDLDISAVRKFKVQDDKSSVNIAVSDYLKSATVAERGGYPASLDKLATVLSELREQTIASKQPLGKGAWAKNKLKAPGDGAEGIGTQVEMIGAADKPLGTLVLGQNIDIAGGKTSTPMMGGNQRFVRIPDDGETIWVVSNTFTELEAKPENWLDKAFIDVQKIKEITVTAPKADDSWAVNRADENATDFTMVKPNAGETLDTSKLPASSILSSPTFNDVSGKDKAAELLKDANKVKITTFDGFSYDVQVAKQSKDGSDKYYVSVAVTAEIPKVRAPVKDEKEEDKKKKDEEFATAIKAQEDKLAKEQKFAGWVFEVSEYTINNLLKKRSEIVKLDVPPATDAPAAPGASPAPAVPSSAPAKPEISTSAPISVTTPPVSVPALPKADIKPAPAADANPAAPEKK